MPTLRPALLALPLLVLACDPATDVEPEILDELVEVEARCIGCDWDPPMTNTHGLNGFEVAALDTEGDMYDGWQLSEVLVVLDGTEADHPVYEVHVENGLLFGIDGDGVVFSGSDFVGSLWSVYLEADKSLQQMSVVSFIDEGDRSRYTFSGLVGTPGPESFTCEQDSETDEYSVILFADIDVDPDSGTHFKRLNTIYFGCISGAVGKSAMWGYAPWVTDADTHQAASRAVRADYCGDGTSYTTKGTPLQLDDIFGINQFTDPTDATEAMWGPEGALCLGVPRVATVDPALVVCNAGPLPECSWSDDLTTYEDTLLWTKTWGLGWLP